MQNSKLKRTFNYQGGQSLFELVVAIAISALIIVALVSLATNSIRSSSYSNNKARAATYAQQATEWLRGERDKTVIDINGNAVNGMDNLKKKAASFPVYCLQDLSWDYGNGNTSGCTVKINGTIFYRWVTLSTSLPNGKTVIEADVVVSWTDSQGFHEVTSATNFSDWRQR